MLETEGATPVESAAPDQNTEALVEGAEAIPAAEEKKASDIRKFKLKVDGEEVDEEIDFNDEESMRNKLQLARAAKKRMTESKESTRKAMEIIKAFDNNPETLLERLGPKGQEIAEKYLLKKIQDDMLSPEQKELRDLKRENETYKEKNTREQADKDLQVSQQREADFAKSFQTTIIAAVQKSGLPKSPELVKRMAAKFSQNLEFGLELTPDDLAQEVKNDLLDIVKSLVGDSDGEHLVNMLGKDAANKIRKFDLKSLQEKQGQVFQSGKKTPLGAPLPAPKLDKGYETTDEWKERIRRNMQK